MRRVLISRHKGASVRELEESVRSACPGREVTWLRRAADSTGGGFILQVTHILAAIESKWELSKLVDQQTWLDGKPLVIALHGRSRQSLQSRPMNWLPEL